MELRFVARSLAAVDKIDAEVLACPVWSDARPPHGLAGLCDWRTAGRVSALMRGGFLAGDVGEVLMLPGKPKLTFDKLLVFGAGARADFDEAGYARVVRHMLDVMEGLCARAGVFELPGRADGLITPERAADLLLSAAGRAREHDVWTLVDDAEAKERITQHMIEERRRVRGLL